MTAPFNLVVKLRRRRRELRITQADLAARVGVNPGTLSNWERREVEPRLDSICAWAEELGYDIALVPASGERSPGFLGARR